MTDQISREAGACARWQWMPGMLDATSGCRLVPAHSGGLSGVVYAYDKRDGYAPGQHDRGVMDWTLAVPDLSDPGTVGGLRARGRDVWNDPTLSVSFCYVDDDANSERMGWHIFSSVKDAPDCWDDWYASENEALVAILRSAPTTPIEE
jgi:hypothetical protein